MSKKDFKDFKALVEKHESHNLQLGKSWSSGESSCERPVNKDNPESKSLIQPGCQNEQKINRDSG